MKELKTSADFEFHITCSMAKQGNVYLLLPKNTKLGPVFGYTLIP